MALWKEGYFTDAEVIAWADTQILKSEDVLDDSLIELSLKGPAFCESLDPYIFPRTRKFSFLERFAIKLATLNLTSDESIKQFIDWTSREAMGEDLKIPEVLFGYLLEEASCYDEGNPLNVFNSEIDALKPRCQIIFDEIITEINV